VKFEKSIKLFYRRLISGNYTDWMEIDKAFEYNNLEFVDPFTGQWPFTSDLPTIVTKYPQKNLKLQFVRAFNRTDFDSPGETSDIEYAIVIDELRDINNSFQKQKPIAWVTADDVHYPRCINWQGKNAALTSVNTRAGATQGEAGSGSFKYFVSGGSDDSGAVDSDFTQTLYADNPYGDYVNNFYTDIDLAAVWSPAENYDWINFSLDTNNFTTALDTWYNDNNAYRMQWIAKFSTVGGVRFKFDNRASASILGFYTSSGSGAESFPTISNGQFFKSVSRIEQTS